MKDIIEELESISVFNDPPAKVHEKIDRAIEEIRQLRAELGTSMPTSLFGLQSPGAPNG